MKELTFLFNHFTFFFLVWIVVLIDFVTTLIDAKIAGQFSFAAVPLVLRKLLYYTAYLMLGNVAEYYSSQTGTSLGITGIVAVSGIILYAEIGSFLKKISNLTNPKNGQ